SRSASRSPLSSSSHRGSTTRTTSRPPSTTRPRSSSTPQNRSRRSSRRWVSTRRCSPRRRSPKEAKASMTEAAAPVRRGRPSTGARQRIREAAIEVLKADGYAGLTLAKVASRAGESKPLVTYHCGSKQGLVGAAGRSIAEMITDEVLAAVENAHSVEAVIRGVDSGVERVLDDDDRVARIYFDLAAVSVVEPEVRRTISEVNEQWREVLLRLLSEAGDGLPPAKARVLTVMVIAGMQGMTLERIERGATPERKRARELFIRAAVAAAD